MSNQSMKSNNPKQLTQLLFDANDEVSSLALKELLQLAPEERNKIILTYQENTDLLIRKRIHQLSMLDQLTLRQQHLETEVKDPVFCLWYKIWELNDLHQKSLIAQPNTANFVKQLITNLRQNNIQNLVDVAKYMHNNNFTAVNKADNFDSENYTIDKLVEDGIANDIIFCALIQYLMVEIKLPLVRFAILKGGCGLLDEQKNWLTPAENWQVSKLSSEEHIKVCSPQEFYKLFLTQKITALLTEGNLQEFAFHCQHLTRIKNQSWDRCLETLTHISQKQVPYLGDN